MSCIYQLQKALEMSIKEKAKALFNVTEAVQSCLLCDERAHQIDVHHPELAKVKNPVKALRIIHKCKQCRPLLDACAACAKMGHLHD